MKRSYRVARGSTGAVFLLVIACEAPSATAREEGPEEVVLTATQPVAAFEVRLCVTEDGPPEFEGDGSFGGSARVSAGAVELTVENLDVDPDYQQPQGSDPPVQTETVSDDAPIRLGAILTLNLNGLSAGACTEPQVVQFSAASLTAEQTVTIADVAATFGGEWTNSLCPSNFSDASLSLEIEPI